MRKAGHHFAATPSERKKRRRRAHDNGGRAEALAALLLALKGYRILARRFKIDGGEIDLVAAKADVVAFVEVKLRPTLDEARLAIDFAKCRRMSRAANAWLAANPWAADRNLRGDSIALAPWRWPDHNPGAIELDIG
jgi:putative endonuclease